MSRPLTVMLVAGEASGDALGAGLASALRRKLGPDGVRFVGVGGSRMAAEGVETPFDISDVSLFGLAELFRAVPRVLRRIAQTVALAERERPDVVVLIDSWGFTSRVARRLRSRAPELKLIKYVAPQVWASRPGRARELARMVDFLLVLHGFEPPWFEKWGLPTTFVGNPALGGTATGADPARFRASIGVGPDDPILLVLPGSRAGEIRRLMKPFGAVAGLLKEKRPNLRIVVPAAETVRDLVKERVAAWPCKADVIEGEGAKADAMAAASAALAKSGTVTTQLAMAGCPMVVAYKVHPLTAFVGRRVIRTPYISLINIAAGEAVAPEFIQEHCQPAALARTLEVLLDDPAARATQAAAQRAALDKLGKVEGDPFERAAAAILQALPAQPRVSMGA